ncbi:MAG: molybdopterin-guanine dinucleotide biosynthesis protein B, partial [Planctomycetaceae bacterium]|nr:molybdopterin-guanine dinucleotide biosynthesis protein B [Planctomycetaceae bacterium]
MAMSAVVPRIHIVGRRNSGKTTLVCELVREFRRRGLRVATIKHTHHAHELDTPGKDSHQHREAGAVGVGILSAEMTAVFIPTTRDTDETTRYARLQSAFADCDLILVEGDLHATAVKLEVWRAEVGGAPYADTDSSIRAVISDEITTDKHDVWPRS